MNLIIIVICIIMSGYFSASETAFSTSNKIRLKTMEEAGHKKAKLVLKMIDNFDSLISSILIGNNIVNILSASLATLLFVEWFGEAKGPSISTAVTTIVVLIFGEVTPKSIAKEFPEQFAMFSAPLLNILMWLFTPFNWLFSQWKKLVGLLFKHKENITATEEELLMFVEETAQEGTITEEESDMIHSVIKFSDLEVVDILTPRIDVTAIDIATDVNEIKEVFNTSGYSRLPVYEENIDNIVGTIYYKDFFAKVVCGEDTLEDVIKPAKMVLGTKKISNLLEELKEEQNHIAIVASEYGSILGIITLEDILEELVGDIWDEGDEVKPELKQLSDTEYEVLGTTGIHRLANELNIEFGDVQVTTVNGWIINLINKIPTKGQIIEHKNIKLEILSMNRNRIDKLKLTLKESM